MSSFVILKLGEDVRQKHGGNTHHMNKYASGMPLHSFFFLFGGTVLVDIMDRTYLIQEHQLVIIPQGQHFRIRYFENCTGYMGGFDANFAKESADSGGVLRGLDFIRLWGSPKIELDNCSFMRLKVLFDRIYDEYGLGVKNNEIIKVYLSAILVEADAVYKQTKSTIIAHNNSICTKFLEMLFKGETLKMQVKEYAKVLNVTPNHLNKIVKNSTGKSPSTWIDEAILQKARMLLRTTTLPLSEIAAKVGIMDQSYFARKFKQYYSITPSEYRQKIDLS